jgi:hypothetical protein
MIPNKSEVLNKQEIPPPEEMIIYISDDPEICF